MSSNVQTTISPHNQQPYITREYPSQSQLVDIIELSRTAQAEWGAVPLGERIALGHCFVEEFKKLTDGIPLELALQMGRPISQGAGEIRGFLDRANYLLSIAESSLSDFSVDDKPDVTGFKKYIKRVPVGVVLVISPWNYPYLTIINSILPALLGGNSIILKPSPQTPLPAERILKALTNAGLKEGIFQVVHADPVRTEFIVQHPRVDFIAFTGSVGVGRQVEIAATKQAFKHVALELGGKDPAYVRPDADLEYTVGELVDGSLYNSGQSCCAIERIYVHQDIYDSFVQKFVKKVMQYTLGDPTNPDTNLGPVFSVAAADKIRKQIDDSVKQGAKKLIPEELFPEAKPGTAFVAPQVLVNVNQHMSVMKDESFAPLACIHPVPSDSAALQLMNDSAYGLTASVWTNPTNPESLKVFEDVFVPGIEAGTIFLNRCDYLDPGLAWGGVKASGKGVTLSKYGFDQFTRAKSVHMKVKI